jgi:hypothetical protein
MKEESKYYTPSIEEFDICASIRSLNLNLNGTIQVSYEHGRSVHILALTTEVAVDMGFINPNALNELIRVNLEG